MTNETELAPVWAVWVRDSDGAWHRNGHPMTEDAARRVAAGRNGRAGDDVARALPDGVVPVGDAPTGATARAGRKLDGDEAVRRFTQEGHGVARIAHDCGVSRQAVYDALTARGVDTARKPLPDDQQTALRKAVTAARRARAAQQTARLAVREALTAGVPVMALAAGTGWARETVRSLRPDVTA